MGEQLGTSQVCKGCVLRIGEHKLIVDLIALDLKRYDVIFGMDLLSTFQVVMDCLRKQIILQLPGGVIFSFINDQSSSHPFPPTSSKFLKAKAGSHLSFLASLIGEEKDKYPKRAVLVVSDFSDVFPDELLGLPYKERLNSRFIYIREPNPYPLPLTVWLMSLKVIYFQSIFLIDFYIKRPIYMQESRINFTKLLCNRKFKRKTKLQ